MLKIIKKQICWDGINWGETHVFVFNLQSKIYKHAKCKNTNKVRYYQRQLVQSVYAKLLAVRMVTQDNRVKKTAGVDQVNSAQRFQLIKRLILDGKTSKIKRVWVYKENGKLRSLGIPTIEDRTKQCLIKMALEAEWEAYFETNLYGFRPGYSTADAKWVIARQLQGGPRYFLDADIKSCFDNVNQQYLLKKLKTIKMFERQIQAWLEAGIFTNYSKDSFEINEFGTSQGSVLSPLLVNIALHGLERSIVGQFGKRNEIKVVQYADAFVIFGKTLKSLQKVKEITVQFLKSIELKFSEEKLRLGHSMKKLMGAEKSPGLDFLDCHFRNVKCTIHCRVRSIQGKKYIFKLVTYPSGYAIKRHKSNIKFILNKYKGAPLVKMIEGSALIIKGWTWYHSVIQCRRIFSKLDTWLFARLWRWACLRYKSRTNAKLKCFNVKGWCFGYIDQRTQKSYILSRHDQTKVRRYVKIKANASIFDETLVKYFAKRLSLAHPKE